MGVQEKSWMCLGITKKKKKDDTVRRRIHYTYTMRYDATRCDTTQYDYLFFVSFRIAFIRALEARTQEPKNPRTKEPKSKKKKTIH